MSLLEAKNVGISFGGLRAVDDFNLTVEKKELVAIIGPNGAGKTTVFNMLSGIYQPTNGNISVNGKPIAKKKPFEVNKLGLARTFQNIRLFGNLTVLDNVKIAQGNMIDYNFGAMLLRNKRYKNQEQNALEKALELLRLFDLENQSEMLAQNLPYGEQRKLEIVRALATAPDVLLLDEPAAGMNPVEIENIIKVVLDVREKYEISIILIEHHMSMVMSIADRIKVLDFGKSIAEGRPEEIKNNPKVIEAYLGGDMNS